MNDLLNDGLMDVQEAAAFYSVGRSTIYNLMETGQLQWCKIGGARRIPKRALIELAAANLQGGWARTTADGGGIFENGDSGGEPNLKLGGQF